MHFKNLKLEVDTISHFAQSSPSLRCKNSGLKRVKQSNEIIPDDLFTFDLSSQIQSTIAACT